MVKYDPTKEYNPDTPTAVFDEADGTAYYVPSAYMARQDGTYIKKNTAITQIDFRQNLWNGDAYKKGYYFDSDASKYIEVPDVACTDNPETPLSVKIIKRPDAGSTAGTFHVTLRLFPQNTRTEVINDPTLAAEAALAEQTFTIYVGPIDTDDYNMAKAAREEADKVMGQSNFCPVFGSDTNIVDIVKEKAANARFKGSTVGSNNIEVSLVSSSNANVIGMDGAIHYLTSSEQAENKGETELVFRISSGAATEITASYKVLVGWDHDFYNTQMANEKQKLTWEKIKGTNTSATEVTSNLTLPQYLTSDSKDAWSEITWISDNPDVISADGTVKRQTEDKTVKLTATLKANPSRLNEAVDTPADFATETVELDVTVKAIPKVIQDLTDLTKSATELLNSMVEGTEAGQYPEGTKEELQKVVDKATEVLNNESATTEETEAALSELKSAVREAKAAQNANTADITIRVNWKESAAKMYQLKVKANTAALYGYKKPAGMENKVTVADALYALHEAKYGEKFQENPEDYLNIMATNGVIMKLFGEDSVMGMYPFYVNNVVPKDYANAALETDDEISLFWFADPEFNDQYLNFKNVPETICEGKEFDVTVINVPMSGSATKEETGCTVELKNLDTNETTEFVTDEKGVAKVIAEKAGNYQLTVTKSAYEYYFAPAANVTVKEHTYDAGVVTKEATCKEAGEKLFTCTECGATKTEEIAKTNDHKFTWKTTEKATVFQPEKQQGTCSVCGKTEVRESGEKLTATAKLNATSIKLQKKQTTKKIKVTMAKGDAVKSWSSSNKKIVTVNKNGVIKAGKKNGTAKITVTLKSGVKATLKVKVQSARVKTTKISGLKAKAVLEKGKKLTLKPVISPLTSQDKVTYTSSNKKVATVSKNGVITAKKKGTVKITVKSGKKFYKVKVTVK